ncbi:hypothetical protein K461DRAFT_32126 [Myriangium duriaei CBS 260.36]|uniref:Uncharacterized protein n=1 Tax=Myriangium duriaei CBS 260.36 TaxID=1168546 RepID=A0A9P4JEN3_9PEZI|nr:hypothetical protein K461DRAFT_32126 [Myriangium duriaei CBS 260.36]
MRLRRQRGRNSRWDGGSLAHVGSAYCIGSWSVRTAWFRNPEIRRLMAGHQKNSRDLFFARISRQVRVISRATSTVSVYQLSQEDSAPSRVLGSTSEPQLLP